MHKGLLIEIQARAQAALGVLVVVEPPLEVERVRLRVVGRRGDELLPFVDRRRRLQRAHDRLRDDREDVLELAVIRLRPQVVAVRGADQLTGDADAVPALRTLPSSTVATLSFSAISCTSP